MSVLFWPVFLFLLAIAFVMLELMIPSGGALSFLAAVSMIASIVVAFTSGGIGTGTVWLGVSGALMPFVIWFAIRWWPHTPFGRHLFNIPHPLKENGNIEPKQKLLGVHGTTESVMLPAGRILVDGKSWDAVSEGMPIEAGQAVEVTRVEGNRIVVRPAQPNQDLSQESTADLLSRPLDNFGLDDLDEPLS